MKSIPTMRAICWNFSMQFAAGMCDHHFYNQFRQWLGVVLTNLLCSYVCQLSQDERATTVPCLAVEVAAGGEKILAAKQCEVHLQLRQNCWCKLFQLRRFPTNKKTHRLWITNINGKDLAPAASLRVGSEHVVSGECTVTDSVPTVNLEYEWKVHTRVD